MKKKTNNKGTATLRQTQGPRTRNIILAILSGGLLTAAWPIWGIAPFIFIAFVPLLLLEGFIAEGERGMAFVSRLLRMECGYNLVGVERHSRRHFSLATERTLYGHRVLAVPPHKKESVQQSLGQFHPHPLLDGF